MTDIALILLFAAEFGFGAYMVTRHITKTVATLVERYTDFTQIIMERSIKTDKNQNVICAELAALKVGLAELRKAAACQKSATLKEKRG